MSLLGAIGFGKRKKSATAEVLEASARAAESELGRALTTVQGIRSPTRTEAERAVASLAEQAETDARVRRTTRPSVLIEDVTAQAQAAFAALGV